MGAAVRTQGTRTLLLASVTLVTALTIIAPGTARAVRCTKPDDLCTGNPCVIRQEEVSSPCDLDFGDRLLVIGGTLTVPNGGSLTLRARDIDVRRAIIGRHATPFAGRGGSIALIATNDITVGWRIDASGRISPGSIALTAGRNITVLAPLRAASNGPKPTAPGGGIFISAGGRIIASGRARMRAEGSADTPGGSIALSAGTGVRLDSRVGADGKDGGSVSVSTTGGDIITRKQISATGSLGTGGSVVAFAQDGFVTLFDDVDAQGVTGGGTVFVIGNRALTAHGFLRARANPIVGSGGTVVVVGGRALTLFDTIYADGARGGSIQVLSMDGDLRTVAPLLVDGVNGPGGSIVVGAAQVLTIDSAFDADGATRGGSIDANARQVTVANRGDLFARGAVGGSVTISGDDVTVENGSRILVDGDQPSGSIQLDATVGDLTLDGSFRARGRGGRIQGSAARGVHASGEFEAAGEGCIGLSAGTTLDIGGAAFDVPVTMTCP